MSGHGCWRKRKEERKKKKRINQHQQHHGFFVMKWVVTSYIETMKGWTKRSGRFPTHSCLCEVYAKTIENEKEKFTSAKIGYNCSIHNPIILGRKALKDAAGSCTNSCRIFRNLLMTREPAVLSWCSISDNCWRVKVWSSGWTICSVTAGPSWTFKFSNNASRKPRISSVVSVTWVNKSVLMVDI